VLFSVVWSIGAALEEKSRKRFNGFLSKLIIGEFEIHISEGIQNDLKYEFVSRQIEARIPDKQSLFELCFDGETQNWLNWSKTIEKYVPPKDAEFHNIFVPTNDSIRNNYFLHLCIRNGYHMLVCGPTGTGKTMNIVTQLNQHFFNPEYTNLCTSFSGQTVANQVQRQVEAKVCTRRRKGYFGPEEGKRCIVIFIDDLNMPAKEVYGAQPPIELLRQWMDNGGWYDLDTKDWKFLQDIVFVTAMLPPTGGRNAVTMRYLRHFNLLYVEPFEEESLKLIFTNILEWYIQGQKDSPSRDILQLVPVYVSSTIELYNTVQISKELLPTPAKSHYIYNLRDISKVFQGIAKSSYKSYKDSNDFTKLWAHECMRVFQDRLINDTDQEIFLKMLKDIVSQRFKRNWDELVPV